MKFRSWYLAVLVVVVAILATLAYCLKTAKDTTYPAGYNPKCPAHPFAFEVVVLDTTKPKPAFVTRELSTVALSGELTPVVEVHDCQRLILADGSGTPVYGPLATIFASDSLAYLFGNTHGTALRAAAVIYSWGPGDPPSGGYSSLGISPGWNCLYVYQAGVPVQARMVRALYDTDCLRPPPDTGGTALSVTATPPPSGRADDIPPVARWAGDSGAGARPNHIWIRCGDMSCEIGPQGFSPERRLPAAIRQQLQGMMASPEAKRVLDVGGWYDQQLLAVPGASGALKPSTILATLVPVPSLGSLNSEGDFSEWQVVAFAILPEASVPYYEKMNFGQGINVISMRHGPMGTALPAGATLVRPCATGNTTEWWASIKSANGVEKFFCVRRWVHTMSSGTLPGTVRWQWLDTDEKTWIRCPQGCCPVT